MTVATYAGLSLGDVTVVGGISRSSAWGSPDYQVESIPLAGSRSGSRFAGIRAGSREITVEGDVSGTSESNTQNNIRALKALLDRPRERLVLDVAGDSYWIATPVGSLQVAWHGPLDAEWRVTFATEDGYAHAITPVVVGAHPLTLTETFNPNPSAGLFRALALGMGPVAYYPCDDLTNPVGHVGLADISGNGSSLLYNTVKPTYRVPGLLAATAEPAAERFAAGWTGAANQCVQSPKAGGLVAIKDDFSIWFTIKRSGGVGTLQGVIGHYLSGGLVTGFPTVLIDTSNRFVLQDVTGGTPVTVARSTALTDTTTAHTVCITKSGAATKIWVDKVDVTTLVTNVTFTGMDGENLYVGIAVNSVGGGLSNPLNAVLDHLLFYKRALTQAEVTQLHDVATGVEYLRYAGLVTVTAAGQGEPPQRIFLGVSNGSSTPSAIEISNVSDSALYPRLSVQSFEIAPNTAIDLDSERGMAHVANMTTLGVVGYYPCHDTASPLRDFSGAGKDLTGSGGVTYAADGPVDAAVETNGTSGFWSRTDTAFGLTGSFSVGCRIWIPQVKLDNQAHGVMGRSTSLNGWALQVYAGGLWGFQLGNGSTSIGGLSLVALRGDRWYDLVATWDDPNDTVSYMANGILQQQLTHGSAFTVTAPTVDFTIGKAIQPQTGNTEFFGGRIQDAWVISGLVTQEQAQAIHETGSLIAGLGSRITGISGAYPEIHPHRGSPNTLQIAAYHPTTAPTIRFAAAHRPRYA